LVEEVKEVHDEATQELLNAVTAVSLDTT
jgi:hypothetical protein